MSTYHFIVLGIFCFLVWALNRAVFGEFKTYKHAAGHGFAFGLLVGLLLIFSGVWS